MFPVIKTLSGLSLVSQLGGWLVTQPSCSERAACVHLLTVVIYRPVSVTGGGLLIQSDIVSHC